MSKNTQLTLMNTFNINNIVFNKPVVSNGAFRNQYIPINIRNPDGTIGDLIIQSVPNLFSFGIMENIDKKSGLVDGYSFPLYMWNRNGCSTEEKEWTDKFLQFVNLCKDHILQEKQNLGCWELERSDLRNMASCLWWKKDKRTGKIQENTGPTLYIKMMGYKNDGDYKFVTTLYDANNGDTINPRDIIQKRCHVTAAIKIESIFIGSDNKIRLQVKLWEADVKLVEVKRQRLLPVQLNTTIIHQETDDTGYGSIDELDDAFIAKPNQEPILRRIQNHNRV